MQEERKKQEKEEAQFWMEEQDKSIQLERTVFFCDAVVAIAITLLALDLKPDHTADGHFSFLDLWHSLHSFPTFILSFLNIASFWRIHHMFFAHIKKVDQRLLITNITWLFFIVLLPFSTSLLGDYFFDKAAIFIYCLNTLFITIAQNAIWDYAAGKPGYMDKEKLGERMEKQMRLFCNLDMINACIAIGLAFLSPLIAFIFLYTKLPMIILTRLFWSRAFKQEGAVTHQKPAFRRKEQDNATFGIEDSEDKTPE